MLRVQQIGHRPVFALFRRAARQTEHTQYRAAAQRLGVQVGCDQLLDPDKVVVAGHGTVTPYTAG